MFAIMINEKGGESKRLDFDKAEVTIGRVQGNDIILPKGNVSKRHSRIVFKDGKFIIVDLKSTNGTYVNGRKITSPLVIKGTDKVYIGDFILSVEDPAAASDSAPADMGAPPLPPPARRPTMPPPPPRKMDRPTSQVSAPEADAGADGGDEPMAPPMRGPGTTPFDSVPGDEAGAEGAQGDEEPAAPEPMAPPPRQAPISRPAAAGRPAVAPQRQAPAQTERPTMMGDAPAEAAQAPSPAMPQRPATTMAQPRPIASQPRSVAPQGAAAAGGAAPVRKPAVAAGPAAARTSAPATQQAPLLRTVPAPAQAAAVATPPADLGSAAINSQAFRTDGMSVAMRILTTRLAARIDPSSSDLADAERTANEILGNLDGGLPPGVDTNALARDAAAEVISWGPIASLLGDPEVRELIVARWDRILVEKGGQLQQVQTIFSSPDAVARAVERLAPQEVAQNGLITARLADGTIMRAAIAPLAAHGATMTLRKPRPELLGLADLVGQGILAQQMASLLEIAVDSRRNILVSGAPGSGRTMLLGALAGAARDNERLITIEDGEDLALRQPNWIQLTTRGGPREAIESALRLRPDRLIIDDVHSPSDALAVIAATAALPGAMASINGASATDAITRLEGLALLAKGAPDVQTLREVMAQSIHVIVQLGRAQDGAMRIVEVAEVTGIAEGGHPALADVYLFKPDEGRFSATGHVPAFATGAPPSLFRL